MTNRDLVDTIYRIFLGREVDPVGERDWVRRIEEGAPLEQLVAELTGSPEFGAKRHRFLEQLGAGSGKFINEHSQFGEVEILIKAIVNRATRHRIVVDVGARGVDRSNSFDLLKEFGWRGLLIEANPRLGDEIRASVAGLDAEVLSCAVADYEGEAEFFFGINDDVSSLERGNAETWGDVRGSTTVSVRRLPSSWRSGTSRATSTS